MNCVSRSVSVVLMLVTVTVCVALVLGMGTLPKLSEAGEMPRTGGSRMPVPVMGMLCLIVQLRPPRAPQVVSPTVIFRVPL